MTLMMSHHIHSYICFILKPRKIWWSQGSCCHPWASLRYNFPQMHLKRSRRNCSQRNFTVKNSFFSSLDRLCPWGGHGEGAGAYPSCTWAEAGSTHERVPSSSRGAPYVSIWRLAQGNLDSALKVLLREYLPVTLCQGELATFWF